MDAIEENYPVQTEKKLFSFVEEGNLEGATAQATSFFNWMLESNAENVMDIKLKVLEFVLWAEKIGYESGGMVYRFSSRHDYLKSINDMSNYEEIRTWFITKIQDVCRNIVNKKEEQATNLIAIAKDYIDHNYQNEVSLDETSRQIISVLTISASCLKKRWDKVLLNMLQASGWRRQKSCSPRRIKA